MKRKREYRENEKSKRVRKNANKREKQRGHGILITKRKKNNDESREELFVLETQSDDGYCTHSVSGSPLRRQGDRAGRAGRIVEDCGMLRFALGESFGVGVGGKGSGFLWPQ